VATRIRLKRLGKIRTPHYRVVVIDSRTKRDGRPIEEIGQYHPKSDPSVIIIKSERAQYWLGVGAQPSEPVIALLKRTGDWQKFTGDTSPAGVEVAPPKPDKAEIFNRALAEADGEPLTAAISKGKKSKKASATVEVAEDATPAEVVDTETASAPVEEVAPAEVVEEAAPVETAEEVAPVEVTESATIAEA
jgi:small subunit ribosomal protein S16